jgi:2-oxoacid:acceptor oxidoreductase delta subunit (pyruvate/2-ketoisovalerate family)
MGGREEIDQNPSHPRRTIVVVGNGVAELACVYFIRRLGHRTVQVLEGGDISRVSEKMVAALGLSSDTSVQFEIEGALRLKSGIGTGVTGSVRMDPQNIGEHDAVVWGLDSEPPAGIRAVFQLSKSRVSVSQAVGAGKEGAIAVDLYLKQRDLKEVSEFISLGPSGSLSFGRYLRFREEEVLEKQDVVRFEEINTRTFKNEPRLRSGGRARPFLGKAFGEQEGVRAARRCFACGWCTLCGQCIRYCPEQVVERESRGKGVQFDYEFCKGCGICVFECPRGALDFVKEEAGWE